MTSQKVIDSDIHCNVPVGAGTLPVPLAILARDHRADWLQRRHRHRVPGGAALSRSRARSRRTGRPGSSLDLLRAQVLDARDIEYAILNCAYAVDGIRNPYGAAAMASAVNDWLIAEWLDKEPRLRASLVVPSQYPDLAVKEIDRVGDHRLRAGVPAGRSEQPYGNRRYFPIFEAASRHNLVAGIQFGGAPGIPPPRAAGPPTTPKKRSAWPTSSRAS